MVHPSRESGNRYHFHQLSLADRKWYQLLYAAWSTGTTEASIPMPGKKLETPSGLPFLNLMRAVVYDNPFLFHLDCTQYQFKRLNNQVFLSTRKIYTASQFRERQAQLNARISQIVKEAAKYDTKEKQVRFLHDYLVTTVTYDECTADPQKKMEAHTIAGALLNRRCVCDGFSRAFQLLCDALGIFCIIVRGKAPTDGVAEDHVWNIVGMEGVPYHVDVTWGSAFSESNRIKYFEYLLGDASAGRRHSWNRSAYPRCPGDYPRREPIVSSYSELEAECIRQISARNWNFLIRLEGPLQSKEVFTAEFRKLRGKLSRFLPKTGSIRWHFYKQYHYAELEYTPDP